MIIMKSVQRFGITILIVLGISYTAMGQAPFNEERMMRDIEVAENVLATLIKQELEQQRTIFGLDVDATYQPGYGVTFRVPSESSMPFAVFNLAPRDMGGNTTIISDGGTYRYSFRTDGAPEPPSVADNSVSLTDRLRARDEGRADSTRTAYNTCIIRAAQNFIVDYGEFLSQLAPDERIVVTNQSDRMNFYFNRGSRSRIVVEGMIADVAAFRQGKITREQAIKRLKVLNTEISDRKEADLEMLSSIFSRLYRPDLSRTYFTEGNVYYERLLDFGAVFYMRVLSSSQTAPNRFLLPTVGLDNLDQEARDKKVAELYPAFESELRENILEYGRTIKSLEDDENLVFKIVLTRCAGCGIPDTLELSVRASVLKDFNSGKIDKHSALKKITVKKSRDQ